MSGREPLCIAVLFGGRSAEHEISLLSARAVMEHLDPGPFRAVPVGIDREGGFLGPEDSRRLLEGRPVRSAAGPPSLPADTGCVFPVLHGPCGEDGTLQGWLEMLGVPCVGSGCAGSAAAMDKSLAKRVLRDAGLPILSWSDADQREFESSPERLVKEIAAARGFPCFVKPARLGSSVGITRAKDEAGLLAGLRTAFAHGRWALVEPALEARELEVAILDGRPPVVSAPGEIRPQDWYDYQAKYAEDSAELLVPAPGLQPRLVEHLQDLSLAAFRALRLAGMARVDFFLGKRNGRPVLNEVNTIPGFTAISMYPRLMEHSGVSLSRLCERLIDLAVREHRRSRRPAGLPEGVALVGR